MTDKDLIQLLVDNNIYNKRQAKAFVLDLTRTAHFSKAVRRVYDLKAILELERRIEKVQFRKDGRPILWPSLSTGIEKTEEPEPEGQISKLLWPSLQKGNENA